MNKPLWVLAAILCLAGTSILEGAGPSAQWLGVLWTKGAVTVGNATVSSGTTVLPGDVISTSTGASAWIRFRSPSSTVLLADSQVVMLASDSTPSFLLRRGTVIVDEKVVDPVRVAVPGGFVLVKGDPQAGAECEMANVENVATVTVRRGLAEIHSQGAPVILHAGQSARVEAGPDGSEQVAGRINKEIPSGLIQREGQTQELPLTLNEVINWNDLVRTLQAGRAQITLLDGSTLNVGARSTIKILKHDPQAQQTQIELLVGRVQANAQKITTPGGKFELHTKSAVIGTVDTSYVAESDDKGTRVCGVEGVTAVQGTDPNQPKKVYLHKNECAYVPFGGVPTDPVLNPGLTSALANATNIAGGIGGVAGVAGAAGGAAGVAGGFPWAWVAIGGVLASEAGASAAIVTTSNPSPTSPIRP